MSIIQASALPGDVRLVAPSCPPEYQAENENLSRQLLEEIVSRNGKTKEWNRNDFEVGCPLGRGKFGRVYLARVKSNHLIVAIKVLYKSEIRKSNVEHQVLREIEIQTHLKHTNILSLRTYFCDGKRIYLVLDYAAGEEISEHLQDYAAGGEIFEHLQDCAAGGEISKHWLDWEPQPPGTLGLLYLFIHYLLLS
jgi:serine/threonine protein kinase